MIIKRKSDWDKMNSYYSVLLKNSSSYEFPIKDSKKPEVTVKSGDVLYGSSAQIAGCNEDGVYTVYRITEPIVYGLVKLNEDMSSFTYLGKDIKAARKYQLTIKNGEPVKLEFYINGKLIKK